MTDATVTLITGGNRSGKSRLARERMASYSRKIFLATAVATDPEMEKRIERHRKERDSDFVTVEEPVHLTEAIRRHLSRSDAVLVDCLTFWLNNLFHYWGSDASSMNGRILREIQDFLLLLEEKPVSLVLVTNEINMGVVPQDPLSRRFVDQHSWLNQEVARRADEVILMTAGIPQVLKNQMQMGDGSGGDTFTSIKPVPSRTVPMLSEIRPLELAWRDKARQRLRQQTRPEGSLGELECHLERLVAIQERERPSVSKKRIVLFAADHGVEVEGISLYPREVTSAMVYNFLSGGATINAFARSIGIEVQIVDVGVDHEFSSEPRLIAKKIRRGTSNIKEGQAMTESELLQALETGWQMACQAKEDGVELLGVGEMGIGNTTSASAVIAALTKMPPVKVTGRGTGIDDAMLEHKVEVIEEALRINRPFLTNPFAILQSLGGFEIAAISGLVMGAAHHRIPCVIDGWIASAGALVPIRLNPALLDYLFFAHESEEKGHRILLEELDVHPILKLSMRLGEGTGACLAMGVLEAAVRAYHEVATFEEAKVAGKKNV